MKNLKLSYEFFPPRSTVQSRRFWSTLGCLQTLNPEYISMTWGALGTSSQASVDVLEGLMVDSQVPVAAHLTCSGHTEQSIRTTIAGLETMGVKRFVALRGDLLKDQIDPQVSQRRGTSDYSAAAGNSQNNPESVTDRRHQDTQDQDGYGQAERSQGGQNKGGRGQRGRRLSDTDQSGSGQSDKNQNGETLLQHASQLVEILAEDPSRDISVAAYPELHPESVNAQQDIHWLRHKLDKGAQRAITQFFFSADTFLRFRDSAVAAGITQTLVPGILPIHDKKNSSRFFQRQQTHRRHLIAPLSSVLVLSRACIVKVLKVFTFTR